jgi:hypothetical protein
MVVGTALVGMDSGCARGRPSWRRGARAPAVGAIAPPTLGGSSIRSQDGGKLARRIGPKKLAALQPQKPDGPPEVAWSGPSNLDAPQPHAIIPLPAPPDLPPAEVAEAPRTSTSAPPTLGEPPGTSAVREPEATDASLATLRGLVNDAMARLAPVRSYQARMTRQERVGEKLQPVEDVILSVRREPFAVRLEWPDGPSRGREVLYSPVETEGKLQVRTPGALVPRVTLDPTSALVLKSSRHPITEAGLDVILKNLDATISSHEQGRPDGRLSYEGRLDVKELGRPGHRIVEHRGDGETWVVVLDAESLLPALVRKTDASGVLLEHYQFRDVRTNVPELEAASAFSPSARWGAQGGLFGRLAGAADGHEPPRRR